MHTTTNHPTASLAAISRNLAAISERTQALIRQAGGLPSVPKAPRRLSDAERAKALRLLDNGEPVAKVANVIGTTRMTLYSLLHLHRPGFRQRVFHT